MAEKRASKSGSATSASRTAIDGPAQLVDRRAAGRARSRPSAGASKRDDLAPRVHAGVGAAGGGEHDRVAEDAREAPASVPATVRTPRFGAKPWNADPS